MNKILVPFYPIDMRPRQDYLKICADVTGGDMVKVEGKKFSEIAREIRGHNVHAHGRGFPFPEMGSIFGRRTVYTPHFNNIGSRYLTKKFRKFLFNKYGKVLALTPHGKAGLMADGIDESRIEILPLPIDYKFFSSPRGGKSFRKKFGLGKEKFVLASDMRSVKNPRVIIDACRKAGAKLVYIGGLTKKELRYDWRVPSSDIIKNDDVVFTGLLKSEQVLQALDAATVFVNSSEYESFCLAAYEAASAGVPMCLPEIGTFDVFRGTALFHHRHDSSQLAGNIERYLSDAGLRKRFSKGARKKVVRLDYDKVKSMYEDFYERVGFI